MRTRAWLLAIMCVSGCACDGPSGDDGGLEVDAGGVDGGEVDAGEVDAGEVDAGEVDAGGVDAGEVDAGEVDAGEVDAGHEDAGAPDSGVLDAGCPTDFHVCGSDCVPNSSATQCGASCVTCTIPLNGVAICDAGSCDFVCEVGFHRCGSQCEADDPTQCGPSCAACPAATAGTFTHPTCTLGVCAVSCIDSCGTTCVNRQVDPLNCGSCGHACGAGERCSRGRCATPCPNGIDFEGATPQWGGALNVGVGRGPLRVTDLDGDGLNDIYAPRTRSDGAGLSHLGVGRGRFRPSGFSPDLAADVDQDGKLERLTAVRSTTTRIEWQDGGVATFTTPTEVHQLRVARGKIYEASSTGLSILALDGSLTWLITGEEVFDFLLNDLDLDGRDDFIVQTRPPSQPMILTLRRGLADGGLGGPSPIGPAPTECLELFDFTGDGLLDVMTCSDAFPGLADGGFDGPRGLGPYADQGVPFDIDGDGHREWILSRTFDFDAVWPEPDGGTRRVHLPLFSSGPANLLDDRFLEIFRVGAGDVDNDGLEDLLYQVPHGEGGALLGRQDAGLRFHQVIKAAPTFAFADVTFDGFVDLVVPGQVWINDGAGRFDIPMSVPVAAGPMIAADLNGDGVSEIIQTDRVFMSSSAGPFMSVQAIPNGEPLATADFDRNGRVDILQTSAILFQDLDGGFQFGPPLAGSRVTDLDLDSWPDVLLDNTTAGVAQWADNVRGNFMMRPLATCERLEVFADFDNDGIGDLGCRAVSSDVWVFMHGAGNGEFVSSAPATMSRRGTGASAFYDRPTVGDFDGDGNLDLAYGHGVVYRGHGDGTFSPSETWTPDQIRAGFPVAIDVDNDGHDDLVLGDIVGRIHVLRSVCR